MSKYKKLLGLPFINLENCVQPVKIMLVSSGNLEIIPNKFDRILG